jgi:tetratricopeptide (TPR) repeat protein
MSFAMNQGLLTHGDVKPSNLLIDLAGILRITDFGLAKFVRAVDSKTEAAGTLLYMAPEQFVSPGSVSFKADIYAIGIVLYQLVTGGSYPYRMPNRLFAVEDFARLHLSAPVSGIDTPFWSVLEECLSKNPASRPSFEELRREVSAIAGKIGLVIEAIPRFDGQSKELYAKAQSLTALGEGRSALGAIEEYIRRFPQYPWGWTEKGVILLHLDQVEEAIAATRESLRLDPNNSHAWNNLGIALTRRDQDTEAAMAFRKALEHDPYNTGSMMSLANILVQQGESKTPARLLLRALKLHPKKKTLLFNATNIAAQIVKNGGLEEARELLECVTKNEPTNVASWFNLALVHQASKKTSQAIECYRKVVDLEPTDSTALTFLAKRLAEIGEFSEGIEICERCLQIGTKREDALVLKAQLLNAQGHYSSAVRLLTDELTANPNADMLWFILATIHEANGALREAQSAAHTCKSILAQEKRFDTDNYLMVDDFLQRLKRTS